MYAIEAGQVTIRDSATSKLIWSGRFEAPIWVLGPLQGNLGCLILLDPSDRGREKFRNLLLIDPDGRERWRARLPLWPGFPFLTGGDAFTHTEVRGGRIFANTWSGYFVEIDPRTGTLMTKIFVK